jgi:hypothetical protein
MEQMEAMDDVDLSHMNFAALSSLRERIEEKQREMRELGGPALLAEMTEKAAELGLTVEEVVQANGKRRGRPPKPRDGEV